VNKSFHANRQQNAQSRFENVMSAFGVKVSSSTMNQLWLTFYRQTVQQLQLPTQKMG
jgi:hypothetical protein